MNKLSKERAILELSKSLLVELYGSFKVDDKQLDSPDAAIFLDSSNDKIGIEITSVDSQKAQQYFGDEKISKDVVQKQLDKLILNNEYDSKATKKMTVSIEPKGMAEQILKKSKKYDSYKSNDDYKELIILAFSEYIVFDKSFKEYLKPIMCNELSINLFQFDKVIFVSLRDGKARLLFDKKEPMIELVKNMDTKISITKSQSSILPFGKTVSIKGLLDDSEPIVEPNFIKKKYKK